jgi:predicted transcriptional regulator
MAIHPEYAEAILLGRKHVEFRKRPVAPDVRSVVIYATAPVKGIIGEFAIDRVLVTSPQELWASVGAVGGITESAFRAYYADSDVAVGLIVKNPRRYPSSVPLNALQPEPAVPQSFSYLPTRAFDDLQQLVARPTTSLLSRLAGAVGELLASTVRNAPARTKGHEVTTDKACKPDRQRSPVV